MTHLHLRNERAAFAVQSIRLEPASHVMVLTISKSLLCLVLLAGTSPLSAIAQKYVPPPPVLTPGPCVPTKKDPCETPPAAAAPSKAAAANPFPGDQTESKPAASDAAAQNPFPGESSVTKPAPPSAATDNPFPGESSPKAPSSAATQNPFPGEPAESSSSSSSSSGTTTGADSIPDPEAVNPNKPLTRTQRRHLAKVEDLDHRELEDLDVSKYFLSTGNFKGAYLRAKDAVTTMPDDSEAHFSLAVASAALRSNEEAISEYKKYVEMDPDGIHAKAAKKALAAMSPK